MVYIRGFSIGSDDRIAGCSTQHGTERRIDGASGFYRFLVFQDENCLPTSPSVCGGCGRQERRWAGAGEGPGAGFGSLWICSEVCVLFEGGAEAKRTTGPGETSPPPHNIPEPPSPCLAPAKNRFSTHPFCRIIFFHRSSVRSEAIWGGGVAEGLPRPPRAGEHPALRPRSAPPSPRVAQGPLPLHGARSGALSHRQPRRRVPPRRHHPAARGAALGCAGLPSSIYSRAPVTSGFTARGESQPTRVFLLCL